MKTHTTGKRHPLLIYRRKAGPAWQTALGLGLIAVVGQQLSGQLLPFVGLLPFLPSPFDEMLLVSGIALVVVGLFLFMGSRLAYTQARADHLLIATPFTRIQISYRRVRSIHPANIAQLYPPENLRDSARSFLEPFLGKTAVVVELNSLPLSPGSMRFFLGTHSLLPHGTGLILLVPDWMSLSTELDSIYGNWRQGQSRSPGTPGRGRGGLLQRLK